MEDRIINFRKSQFPSIQNCTECHHHKEVPVEYDEEGHYCFEGCDSYDLSKADLLDDDCVNDHICNFFMEKE